jgi:uncharacterized protein YecT (DUF1311 family)
MRRSFFLAGLVVVTSTLGAAPPAAVAGRSPSPPVIRESFTLLPCPTSKAEAATTVGMEGCLEHEVVRTDRKIDAVVKQIFSSLGSDAARARLVKAQRAWLSYRTADCSSIADKYEGGTLVGVVASQCTADRSARHLVDVRSFLRLLRQP